MNSADDEARLARIRQGDANALAEYIAARRHPLLAFIERKLGAGLRKKLEPEDVFQELCVDAVRALPTYRAEDREPFGWLCQLAERRIIDAHRHFFGSQKRAADRELPLHQPAGGGDGSRMALVDLLVASITSPSAAVSRDIKHLRMMEALNSLPEDQREALRLRYLEGMPSKEIAERLGKTDGAVRVMLTRALGKLETLLGPNAAPRT